MDKTSETKDSTKQRKKRTLAETRKIIKEELKHQRLQEEKEQEIAHVMKNIESEDPVIQILKFCCGNYRTFGKCVIYGIVLIVVLLLTVLLVTVVLGGVNYIRKFL